MGRTFCAVVLVAASAAAGLAFAGNAAASPWCGTVATSDRPEVVGGNPIRIVYAVASDGPDQGASLAPLISADVDGIAAWWRTQDGVRAPRFDLAAFPCGPQADIILVRLAQSVAQLRATAGRFSAIANAIEGLGPNATSSKYLVFYDGPVDEDDLCGTGGGSSDGDGVAIVFTAACRDVPSDAIAAHELLHALGAMPVSGPAHPCPGDAGHPCDSENDLLFPYASTAGLGGLLLDAGHDDYYAHAGSWFDAQDSLWLRHLEAAPALLTVSTAGGGSIESTIPGVNCASTCAVEFDGGTTVTLGPNPDPGRRFVRWSGGCSGSGSCALTLGQATTVGALFAPASYRLTVAVAGKGTIRGSTGSLACPKKCSATVDSYVPVALRAVPARGWRLGRWSGGCAGSATVCRVPMTAATGVRAVFVRK